MADVFPRRNLPDDAEQWGRSLESTTLSLRSDVDALQQSLQGQNRNTASSLAVIGAQVKAISETQEALEAQQAILAAQQADIIATQTFLSTQTVFDSRSNNVTWSGTPGGTIWLGYDGTYDCSLTVTTGGAGKLLIQVNSTVVVGAITGLLGIEIVGVAGPSIPGPFSTYVTSNSGLGAGVSRNVVASLSPNSTYTVRSRRGVMGSSAGSSVWDSPSLVVTRS